MKLAHRIACEYNPIVNTFERDEDARERQTSWRFKNPVRLLGPQSPLELKYRRIAYQR